MAKSIRISDDAWERLRVLSFEQRVTMGEVVEAFLAAPVLPVIQLQDEPGRKPAQTPVTGEVTPRVVPTAKLRVETEPKPAPEAAIAEKPTVIAEKEPKTADEVPTGAGGYPLVTGKREFTLDPTGPAPKKPVLTPAAGVDPIVAMIRAAKNAPATAAALRARLVQNVERAANASARLTAQDALKVFDEQQRALDQGPRT